jgi:hypothetical protein
VDNYCVSPGVPAAVQSGMTTPQQFPISQQLRDEVERARRRWLASGHTETAEQQEALRAVGQDTLTNEELVRVAHAFSMSADALLELTNLVREVGAQGGPG